MKMLKRTIASLLATLILMTSVNVSFASKSLQNEESIAVAKVGATGIMQGTTNGFEGDKTLTRAEAAAIMVRLKGIKEAQANSAKGNTLFDDVKADSWAAGYINVASSYGIIKGVGKNKFAPDQAVTVAEVYTMAIRALGAGLLVDNNGAKWPTNYVNFAGEIDLTDSVNQIYTQEATRYTTAQIVANTLEANIWEKESVKTNGEITWTENKNETLLSKVLKIDRYENAKITKIDVKDREISFEAEYLNGEEKSKKNKGYNENNIDVADDVDMSNLKKGLEYDIWYNKDSRVKEVIGIWKSESSKQKDNEYTEIKKITDRKITLVIDGKEKEYKITDDSEFVYNNSSDETLTKDKLEKAIKDKENVFGTIVLDGSNIDTLYVEEYTNVGLVKKATSSKIEFESIRHGSNIENCKTLRIDDDDIVYNVTKNGKEIKVDDIKEDDVVFYYTEDDDDDIYHILVATDKVEGKITSVSTTSNYIKIDGKKYEVVKGLDFDADDEVVIYLNKAGKVVMADDLEVSNNSYAVIKEMQAIENNRGDVSAEITLVTSDGKEMSAKEVDIEESADELFDNEDKQKEVLELLFGISNSEILGSARKINNNYGFKKTDSMLGRIIRYKEKGKKIVITELKDKYNNKEKVKEFENAVLSFGNKSSISDETNGKYYFTSATVYMTVKATSKDYKVNVSVVDKDDLDTSRGITASVANYNDDKEAKLVALMDDTNLKREKAEKFAIVLSQEDTSNDDYEYEYEILYTDGSKETYYSDESLRPGNAYELQLSGDVITDAENYGYAGGREELGKISKPSSATLYIADISNDIIKIATVRSNKNTTTVRYDLASDVAYVKNDDGEYEEGRESDITELDLDRKNSATEIEKIFTYTDDAGITEVIAIIYKEEENDDVENNEVKDQTAAQKAEEFKDDYADEILSKGFTAVVNGNELVLTQIEAKEISTLKIGGLNFTKVKDATLPVAEVAAQKAEAKVVFGEDFDMTAVNVDDEITINGTDWIVKSKNDKTIKLEQETARNLEEKAEETTTVKGDATAKFTITKAGKEAVAEIEGIPAEFKYTFR